MGWYQIREQKHTDTNVLVARANELAAETRRLLARDRKPARQRQAPSGSKEATPGLVAMILGPSLGRKHQHDPFSLARAVGLSVERVPLAQLQDKSRPGVEIRGRLLAFLGYPVIQVADSLHGRDELFTVAHDCAHYLLGKQANESDCNDFARRFLAINDDEWPTPQAARWRRWQRQALEAQRWRARAVAGAR